MSTVKLDSPVLLSFAFAHCVSLCFSRSVSGLVVSPSRLAGSVCNGFRFVDQLYVDDNCSQVESIEQGTCVEVPVDDLFLCTTVGGLARLGFRFFLSMLLWSLSWSIERALNICYLIS